MGMELSQMRVTLTLVITFLITGLACLPLERRGSASDVVLIMALVLCVFFATVISIVIYFRARKDKNDFLD